mgnify:CR=1 FL=1
MLTIEQLYDLNHTLAADYLRQFTYPWEALAGIKAEILRIGAALDPAEYTEVSEHVWVHKTATVAPTAYLGGPLIIDENAEIRHCAFLRGSAIVGKGATVGNSTELKNCILFDGAQAPHYNYVGDSILGYKAHMGAGAITSNFRSDHGNVTLHGPEIATGLRKFGAMLGDEAEIGCGSVLNPGTIVGRGSIVYPLSSVRGIVAEKTIYKRAGEVVAREER